MVTYGIGVLYILSRQSINRCCRDKLLRELFDRVILAIHFGTAKGVTCIQPYFKNLYSPPFPKSCDCACANGVTEGEDIIRDVCVLTDQEPAQFIQDVIKKQANKADITTITVPQELDRALDRGNRFIPAEYSSIDVRPSKLGCSRRWRKGKILDELDSRGC